MGHLPDRSDSAPKSLVYRTEVPPMHLLRSPGTFVNTGSFINVNRTREEDVEVGKREPREKEIERVVHEFQHQRHFTRERVIRSPNLSNVYQRVHLVVTQQTSQPLANGISLLLRRRIRSTI